MKVNLNEEYALVPEFARHGSTEVLCRPVRQTLLVVGQFGNSVPVARRTDRLVRGACTDSGGSGGSGGCSGFPGFSGFPFCFDVIA